MMSALRIGTQTCGTTQHQSLLQTQRPSLLRRLLFVRDSLDEKLATLLVGRLYPSRALFATVTDSKGGEDIADIQRLSSFFKESGIQKLVYNTGQESSDQIMVDDLFRRTGTSGIFNLMHQCRNTAPVVPRHPMAGQSAPFKPLRTSFEPSNPPLGPGLIQ